MLTAKQILRVHFRWLIKKDDPACVAIDADNGIYSWSRAELRNTVSLHTHIGQVAEMCDRIVGWMVFRLDLDSICLVRLVVDPQFRRHTVGTQMVDHLKGKLSPHRRRSIVADVPETQLGACLFLRACGFAATTVLRGEVEETGEDAYRFVFQLREGRS